MLRFLQKPGPLKKIILGGILVVICVMMVITLVPGGLFGAIAVGVPPLALLVLTVIRNDAEPVGPINALEFGALLIGAGVVCYFLSERTHDHRRSFPN